MKIVRSSHILERGHENIECPFLAFDCIKQLFGKGRTRKSDVLKFTDFKFSEFKNSIFSFRKNENVDEPSFTVAPSSSSRGLILLFPSPENARGK